MYSAQAKDRVTLGIVLNHLIEKNQLSPQPDQVRALIEEWSQSYEDPKEMIDWFYGSPERLQEPEGMVSEQNVVDYVLSQAKVIETPIDFDTLMENA
jgi:trigger factor